MAIRLQSAKNAVAAIDVKCQLVAAIAELHAPLVARPGDDFVDMRDGVRVAHPDNPDMALPLLAGAFELYAQLARSDELGPGHATGARVVLLIDAIAHVDVPTKKMLEIRIGALVHGVRRNRCDRAALLGMHRRHPDVVMRDLADYGLLARIRLGAKRGAFHDLAVEIRERQRIAGMDGGRSEDRTVAAAATDDDVGSLL